MFGKHYLKTYQGVLLLGFKLLDILLVAGVATLANTRLLSTPLDTSAASLNVLLTGLIFILTSERTNLYRPWRGKRLRYELLLLIFLSGASVLFSWTVLLMADLIAYNQQSIRIGLIWFALQATALSMTRMVVRPILNNARRRGANRRRIAFVGLNDQVESFLTDLERHPEFGIECLGYYDDRLTKRLNHSIAIPRLGALADLAGDIAEREIDQVWFAYPISATQRTESGINALRYSAVAIRQILDRGPEPASITGILGMPLIDIDVTMTDGMIGGLLKSAQDRVAAALILAAISPLMLAIAIGVKLSSPGPVFYRQTRVTWKNEPFEILKFRSMPVNAEFENGNTWSSTHKRTTRFGRFIRSTSLDELPQFINVLRGEMAIVGPRPERTIYVEQFKDQIPSYMKKHRVKAGITGWAQVNGLRGDTDLFARIEHDLYYIRNWSPLFDLEIALRTILLGVTRKR